MLVARAFRHDSHAPVPMSATDSSAKAHVSGESPTCDSGVPAASALCTLKCLTKNVKNTLAQPPHDNSKSKFKNG